MTGPEKNFTSSKESPGVVLSILAILLALSLYSAQFLSYKLVTVGNHIMPASGFVIPLWYLFGNVATEIYGYKASRKLVWLSLIATLLFLAFLEGLIRLPPPGDWQYQFYYDYVIGHLIKVFLAGFIGIFVGGFVSNALLSKWKILAKGKYYWFRSLISSIVGQAIYIVIALIPIFYDLVSTKELIGIMLISLLAKVIIVAILISPIAFMVNKLKKLENTDVYDYSVSYNPFKFS